jgi:hypothetical protein
MRIVAAAAIVLGLNSAALAEAVNIYPVSVPQECVVLAQREGVPTMIENRYQAAKARLKLARLSGKDPMVQECRAAVERMRKAVAATANAATANQVRQSQNQQSHFPQ